MPGRVCVIVNPAAGRGRGARTLPAVREAFAAVGVGDVRTTEAREDERAVALLRLHAHGVRIVDELARQVREQLRHYQLPAPAKPVPSLLGGSVKPTPPPATSRCRRS